MVFEHMTPAEFKKASAGGLKKKPKPRDKSQGEETLALQLTALKIPFEREVTGLYPPRKWRVDFLLREQKIVIEVEGGIWSNGRHQRGTGFEEDCNKYNSLAIMGYKVLRFSSGQVKKGEVVEFLKRIKSLNIP